MLQIQAFLVLKAEYFRETQAIVIDAMLVNHFNWTSGARVYQCRTNCLPPESIFTTYNKSFVRKYINANTFFVFLIKISLQRGLR